MTGKGKKLYKSKTFWVNIIALVSVVVDLKTGQNILTAEQTAGLLGVINVILRMVTNEKIDWS